MTTTQQPFIDQPVFIIGLQKSGTSLLNRLLLQHSQFFFAPFPLEGRAFWGDDPPFSPTQSPCGRIYQSYAGSQGHQIGAVDFSQSDQDELLSQVRAQDFEAPIWINKNPYNVVRVPWLKKMFPKSFIVAVMRKPEANVFSLKKKFIPHDQRGLGPENGWWGVKPEGWTGMLHNNLNIQLARQWQAVNQQLLDHRNQLDLLVDYQDVCRDPAAVLNRLFDHFEIDQEVQLDPLPDMNQEYKRGSRLLSKNREFKNSGGDLSLPEKQDRQQEIKKLSFLAKRSIRHVCQSTWKQCLKVRTRL